MSQPREIALGETILCQSQDGCFVIYNCVTANRDSFRRDMFLSQLTEMDIGEI